MKITITGSLGHISNPLAKELIENGHSVTIISSKLENKSKIESLGATAAIGTIEDVDFLTTAFTSADAVYTMIPPDNFFDQSLDLKTYYGRIATNYFQAIEQAGVKRLVHLSSIGAHLDKESGIILAHHNAENILDKLSNVGITFMRPTAFYYNLNSFINVIKNTGTIMSNYGEDDKIVWVSPIDIATSISEELQTPLVDRKIKYVASDELTCNEVAIILGNAIGKSDLKWTLISSEQLQSGLVKIGMNPSIAAGLAEMNESMHNGKLFEDYYKNKPVLGQVKLTDFAKEFATAF